MSWWNSMHTFGLIEMSTGNIILLALATIVVWNIQLLIYKIERDEDVQYIDRDEQDES